MRIPRYLPHALVLIVALASILAVLRGVYTAGAASVQAEWDAERVLVAQRLQEQEARHAMATAASEARAAANLQALTEKHEQIQSDLRRALAQSDLRNRRLSGELVRLHNRAAGAEPAADAPGDPAAAGGEAPSAADLVETCLANYEIAQRNAERLRGWQDWWRDLESSWGAQ